MSTNCSFFPDFAIISDITVDHCYLPDTPGGYATSLGWNPGKTHNDDPGNATNITFTNNRVGAGMFGRITGWNADASNTFSGNIAADTGLPISPTD